MTDNVMTLREINHRGYTSHTKCYRSSRWCHVRCIRFQKGKPFFNCIHKKKD